MVEKIDVNITIEEVNKRLLEQNDRVAESIRKMLSEKGIMAVEFLGGPGSGKTSLIERLSILIGPSKVAYIGGDVATSFDTERISKLGVRAVQINTGGICHLEALHVEKALKTLNLEGIRYLFIENVGNLICPFEFDVGSHVRVLVVSAGEGEDKFLKHPMSAALSNVIVVNKVDLAPHVGVDVEKMVRDARKINGQAKVVVTSAKTGEGIKELAEALKLKL